MCNSILNGTNKLTADCNQKVQTFIRQAVKVELNFL